MAENYHEAFTPDLLLDRESLNELLNHQTPMEIEPSDELHVTGDAAALASARDILLTASAPDAQVVHEATGRAVVMAPSPKALPDTAQRLAQAYPEAQLFVIGPDPDGESGLIQEDMAAIRETEGVADVKVLTPVFNHEERHQGYISFVDYARCRDNPQQVIHDIIEGGIEAVYEIQAERMAEAQAMDNQLATAPFEVAGDPSVLAGSREILVGANAADAHAVSEATGRAVVIAPSYDALPQTAQRLAQAHPEAQLYLLGPDVNGEPGFIQDDMAAMDAVRSEMDVNFKMLRPRFSPDQLNAGCTHFADYASCGDHPAHVIRTEVESALKMEHVIQQGIPQWLKQTLEAARCPDPLGGMGEHQAGEPILIAHDYATAYVLHQATDRTVVYGAHDDVVKPLAQVLRDYDSEAAILICGDHEVPKTGHPITDDLLHLGGQQARDAMRAVDGHMVLPTFHPRDHEPHLSAPTFYELRQYRGLEAVQRQIESGLVRLEEIRKGAEHWLGQAIQASQCPDPLRVVGERQAGEPILLTCHYAEANALHQATGRAVVHGVIDEIVKPVAQMLREQDPEAAILICGSRDHPQAHEVIHLGREAAQEAAQAVGGKVVTPVFTCKEREQTPPLRSFYDLACSRGSETVKRQVEAPLERLMQERERARESQQEQGQEKTAPGRETSLAR